MSEKEQVSLTVVLGGRPYPLLLDEQEEEMIKSIVKTLNDKVGEFQLKYPRIDKQDALAMTLLTFARDAQLKQLDPSVPDSLLQLHQYLDTLLTD